jgi:hypothetical protein
MAKFRATDPETGEAFIVEAASADAVTRGEYTRVEEGGTKSSMLDQAMDSGADTLRGFNYGLAQMMSGGLLEEIGAIPMQFRLGDRAELTDYATEGLQANERPVPVEQSNYSIAFNQIGEDAARARQDAPWAYGAGEAIGVAGPSMGFPAATGLGARTAAGALEGGFYGANLAEPGEGIEGGAAGALLGGGMAATVPPLLGLATDAVGGVLAAGNRGFPTPQSRAAELTRRVLERDGISAEQIPRMLDEVGPEGRLIDISPNAMVAANAESSKIGPVRQIADTELRGRQQGSQRRLIEAAQEGIPNNWGDDYHGTLRSIVRNREAQSADAYTRAYANPIQQTPELDRILNSKSSSVQDAKRRAEEALTLKGAGSQVVGGHVQFYDEIKRALDDMIGSAFRGGERSRGRDLLMVKRNLLGELDRQNPDYARARSIFAGGTELENALTFGRELLTGKQRYADVQEIVQDFTESEMTTFRIGVVQSVIDAVEEASASPEAMHNAAKRVANSTRARELLRVAFPDDESFNGFIRTVDAEEGMTMRNQRILRNSATAERQMGASSLAGDAAGLGFDVATKNAPGILFRLIHKLSTRKLDDETARELGQLLLGRHRPDDLVRQLSAPPVIRAAERQMPRASWDEALSRGSRWFPPIMLEQSYGE